MDILDVLLDKFRVDFDKILFGNADYVTRTCTESVRTHNRRISPVRCLGGYMSVRGKDAYIYPYRDKPCKHKYVPHIYTDDELERLFNAIDNTDYCAMS